MSSYDPLHDDMLEGQTVEITVKLIIRKNADIQEVVNEMMYDFEHDDILSTEIVDLNTEV